MLNVFGSGVLRLNTSNNPETGTLPYPTHLLLKSIRPGGFSNFYVVSAYMYHAGRESAVC